jgi:hypothetical protein
VDILKVKVSSEADRAVQKLEEAGFRVLAQSEV